ARRGQLARLSGFAVVFSLLVGGSFFWALLIAPDAVTKRLLTLVEDDPTKVYYKNRGQFLEHTITTLLPQYPFGAGIGRWGMMYQYFGDKENTAGRAIWSDIMWTGWLLDGGVPLVVVYVLALLIALITSWRLAIDRRDRHGI